MRPDQSRHWYLLGKTIRQAAEQGNIQCKVHLIEDFGGTHITVDSSAIEASAWRFHGPLVRRGYKCRIAVQIKATAPNDREGHGLLSGNLADGGGGREQKRIGPTIVYDE